MINKQRSAIAALAVSAATLVSIAVNEGYQSNAYKDAVGIPTIGFGETKNVKLGQTTDPIRALVQLQKSADEHAKGLISCVNVPLSQNEFDAYVSFSYNIGTGAFCKSTLVKKLNQKDYDGACKELLRWTRAGGKVLPGLVKRREMEYKQCLGL